MQLRSMVGPNHQHEQLYGFYPLLPSPPTPKTRLVEPKRKSTPTTHPPNHPTLIYIDIPPPFLISPLLLGLNKGITRFPNQQWRGNRRVSSGETSHRKTSTTPPTASSTSNPTSNPLTAVSSPNPSTLSARLHPSRLQSKA